MRWQAGVDCRIDEQSGRWIWLGPTTSDVAVRVPGTKRRESASPTPMHWGELLSGRPMRVVAEALIATFDESS